MHACVPCAHTHASLSVLLSQRCTTIARPSMVQPQCLQPLASEKSQFPLSPGASTFCSSVPVPALVSTLTFTAFDQDTIASDLCSSVPTFSTSLSFLQDESCLSVWKPPTACGMKSGFLT